MIRYLSASLAEYVRRNDETVDPEVLAYGFEILLQEAVVVLITLALGMVFGLFAEVLICLVGYNLLRKYAGGTHARYRLFCIVTSVLVMFGPSFLFGKTTFLLKPWAVALLFALCVVLLVLYAPADTEIRPVQNPQKRRFMRRRSLQIVAVYAVLTAALYPRFPGYACTLAAVMTLVCLLTHPLAYALYGCKKSSLEGTSSEEG